METLKNLKIIKNDWLEYIPGELAKLDGVRASFRQLLIPFFDLLERSVETNEAAWLESLLLDWVTAPTESELAATEKNLVEVLGEILNSTINLVNKSLPVQKSSELITALIPIFTHAMKYVASQEIQVRVKYITNELSDAKLIVERLEKNKSDFISVAAHELKTPLTLIEGYASMLHDALPVEDARRIQAELYIKGMDAGARRLREIVDDMIDVSLIDNDMLSLAFQPVWLNQIVSALIRELEITTNARNIRFEVLPFDGYNEMFFGDGERLFQAIRNVITNAIKYTPDGGTITIDGRSLPGFLEMTVKDTGIGIDPDDHTRIFEKFGRLGDISLHSSGKTKFKGGGPGLGLPITKGIIEAHGGAIWVESDGYDEKECPGSLFHIMLPMRKNPPDDKSARLFKDITKRFDLAKTGND